MPLSKNELRAAVLYGVQAEAVSFFEIDSRAFFLSCFFFLPSSSQRRAVEPSISFSSLARVDRSRNIVVLALRALKQKEAKLRK